MKTRILYIILFAAFFAGAQSLMAQSVFSGERLEQAVMNYLQEEMGEDVEVLLSQNITDQSFSQPDITARCTGDAESVRAMKQVGLEFLHGSRLIRRIEIPVRIKMYRRVPRAARNLASGSVIGEDDIVYSKADITAISEDDIPAENEIVGRTIRRPLTKSGVITRSLLLSQSSVRRGQALSVIVQAGNVSIRTSGKALEDGSAGEMIRISREGNGAVMNGKIIENGVVLVTP